MTLSARRRKRSVDLSAEKPLDSLRVRGRRTNLFVKRTTDAGCLVTAQVALGPLGSNNLATGGDVESALCAFVGLNLRHG